MRSTNFCRIDGICDTDRVSDESECSFYERGFYMTNVIYRCKYNVDEWGHTDVAACDCDAALAEALLNDKLEKL